VRPILWDFQVFGKTFAIHAFGTALVVAFLVSTFWARRRVGRDLGVDRERTFNVCFALLFIGIAGARLLYAFIHHETFAKEPLSFLYIWRGGLTFYGGLLLCLGWLAWYLPRHPDLGGFAFLDRLAAGAGLALFVGRFGSFLSGENYGKVATGLPWAVTFPPGSQAPAFVPLHPTQLYHGLHGLLLFLLLVWLLRRGANAGRATGLFLMLYAAGHALIEVFRADDAARGMVIEGVLSTSQLLSIPLFFAGLAVVLVRKPPERPHPAA